MAFHMLNKLVILFAIYLIIDQTIAAPVVIKKSEDFDLIILHNNDMHARFEQTGVNSNKCAPEDVKTNKCYGGFARTAHEIRKFREEAKKPNGTPVLYLNAGDTYTGTPWFTIFKDNITATFLNLLKPDAISLGNHEFDEGVEGLVPFLNEVDFPVLTCNLDLSKTPTMQETKSLKKSTIFKINGHKVGVIGYLTPDTKKLAKPNTVVFLEEVVSINEEAEKLKKAGVNIIIALGHSGYETDKKIAHDCKDVDVVIGGHTNTFLYNGDKPDIEVPEGPYPYVVKQPSGKEVPVVQAYAYTKYLGHLNLKFDSEGNLKHWDGQPILLNGTIPQDSDVLKLLDKYRSNITELEENIIGKTKVMLDGRKEVCRVKECNLGNLIADSMIYARVKELKDGSPDGFWTDAAIAFVQGGGLRASIDKTLDGAITKNDVISVLPFGNILQIIEVTGQDILDALEVSASKFDHTDSNGGFLQMSGVQVRYNISKPVGYRVTKVDVRCAKCKIPEYSKLDDKEKYKIIVPKFLLEGGDGYAFPQEKKNIIELQLDDLNAAVEYIHKITPLYPSTEWRISFDPAYVPDEKEKPEDPKPKPDPTKVPGGHNSSANIVGSSVLLILGIIINKLY